MIPKEVKTRLLSSFEILELHIANLKNCGSGAPGRPGFQPGNDCGKRSGTRASDISDGYTKNQKIERFEKFKEEAFEYKKKIETDEILTYHPDPDINAKAHLSLLRNNNNYQYDLFQMETEENSSRASNPKEYRKSRDELNTRIREYDKKHEAFIEGLIDKGVRGVNSSDKINIFSISSFHPYKEKSRKSYVNLTDDDIDKCKELREEFGHVKSDKSYLKPYYGNVELEANKTKFGIVEDVIPKEVLKGGAYDNEIEFMKKAKVAIQVDSSVLKNIAKDDRLKNMFEYGAKESIGQGDEAYRSIRESGEEKLFGLEYRAPAFKRPIYGIVESPENLLTKSNELSHYGDVQIVLKDKVKTRTTYTIGDSLDDQHYYPGVAAVNNPSHIGDKGDRKIKADPNSSSNWKVGFGTSIRYLEAQIFGYLWTSDIDAINIPNNVKLPKSLEKRFKEKGVKINRVSSNYTSVLFPRGWVDLG